MKSFSYLIVCSFKIEIQKLKVYKDYVNRIKKNKKRLEELEDHYLNNSQSEMKNETEKEVSGNKRTEKIKTKDMTDSITGSTFNLNIDNNVNEDRNWQKENIGSYDKEDFSNNYPKVNTNFKITEESIKNDIMDDKKRLALFYTIQDYIEPKKVIIINSKENSTFPVGTEIFIESKPPIEDKLVCTGTITIKKIDKNIFLNAPVEKLIRNILCQHLFQDIGGEPKELYSVESISLPTDLVSVTKIELEYISKEKPLSSLSLSKFLNKFLIAIITVLLILVIIYCKPSNIFNI